MLIRPATWRDAERITDLFGKMHKEIDLTPALREENHNPENVFINIITRIKLPSWHIVVAEDNDATGDVYKRVVGFMMSELRWPRYNPCYLIGSVEALYVEPEYRGQGLYVRLVENSVAWGKANNMKEVEFVSSYEPRIMSFYDKLGYVPVQVGYRAKREA